MFSQRAFSVLTGLAMIVVLPTGVAQACACCAEPGERYERTETIDDLSLDVLESVRFAAKARLYTTAADWDEQVKGITNPAQSDTYSLTFSRTARDWTFEFKDTGGAKGKLNFRLPANVYKLHADTKPQARTPSNNTPTRLYKEWRLDSSIAGTGMFTFKKSANGRAQFILHGTGNGCTSPDQFTNWTLDVTGNGVQFRFFGRLRASN